MEILYELLDTCWFSYGLKNAPMIRASGNTGDWFTVWRQNQNLFVDKKVEDLISITNISVPFLNRKISIIPLLFIITNVLIFNKNDWNILPPMILTLKLFYTSSYSLVQLCIIYQLPGHGFSLRASCMASFIFVERIVSKSPMKRFTSASDNAAFSELISPSPWISTVTGLHCNEKLIRCKSAF